MTENDFETFMSEQIQQIRSFRQQLQKDLDREVSVDEAARRWIQEYAEQFRQKYKKQKAS